MGTHRAGEGAYERHRVTRRQTPRWEEWGGKTERTRETTMGKSRKGRKKAGARGGKKVERPREGEDRGKRGTRKGRGAEGKGNNVKGGRVVQKQKQKWVWLLPWWVLLAWRCPRGPSTATHRGLGHSSRGAGSGWSNWAEGRVGLLLQ